MVLTLRFRRRRTNTAEDISPPTFSGEDTFRQRVDMACFGRDGLLLGRAAYSFLRQDEASDQSPKTTTTARS